MFNGTLGDFQTDPVEFDLQLGAKACHEKPYPVPQSQKVVFKKEVDRLLKIEVLERQPESDYGSPVSTYNPQGRPDNQTPY